jgi:hypothetical protein
MPNPPILAVDPLELSYEDFADELEQLALLEDLEKEPPAGPSLADLPALVFDDEIFRVAEDLERLAEAEAR